MDDSYWTRRMASATQHAEVMHVLQALHQDELHRIRMDGAKKLHDIQTASYDRMAAHMAALRRAQEQRRAERLAEMARRPEKELIRGPDGRATHVRTRRGIALILRGPDGRATGLGPTIPEARDARHR